MQLNKNITYREIFNISAPLMLGSAGQNLMVAVEGGILYYRSEADFAAMGFVGMFYLIIAAIGFGVSRGGQIMIARRMGEGKPEEVGRTFYAMLYFELGLAVVMFLFMQFGAAYFFKFVGDPDIYQKTLEFLKYRSYGVFFSYIGLAMIALYTGVARGGIILACTVTLGIVNLVLCYGLVNGVWGLPEMGISGAGLASTIAEIVSFIMFFAYMIWDKKTERYHLLSPRMVDMALIRQQARLSSSTLAQALVSIGSWFVFFAIVERFLGQHDLAITNLVRMVYLCLSIPSWGFFTGINTIVSNIVGQAEHQGVLPVIKKTAWLTFVVTVCFAVPFTLFPTTFLEPIFRNTEHGGVLIDAVPVLRVVLLNLAMSAIGGVYFNGLSGTGATAFGVRIQILCAFLYLAYNYVVIGITHSGLAWAWLSETVYWGVMLALTLWYLRSNRWQTAQV